jgi:hypothetical protein
MVDGLHMHIQHITMKPLAIALSGVGRGLRGRFYGGELTNVQYNTWNCHNESLLYNKYILMKKNFKKKINSSKLVSKRKNKEHLFGKSLK